MKRIGIMVLILCACFVPVAWGQQPQACTTYTPWSQFHRDNMQRFNPCEKVLNVNNVGKLNLKWSYLVGPTGSSPVVEHGVVYVGAFTGTLYALKASTGALLWSYYVGGNYSGLASSPAVANGVVYVGAGDTHTVYALNASTGALVWSHNIRTGFIPNSSPAVANGVVYIGSGDGDLYALKAGTGAKLWSNSTNNYVETSPAVANGVVYFGTNNWVFYAVNAETGAKLWSHHTQYSESSSPAVANGMVYVGDNGGTLYAFGQKY